eukprot:TRINITY_DN4989_c0_g1_i3.p1 TRINITY_DN4989_c0_g1~~TRINITY_DN4989_c0_g1_i3.p1  ORF type:complete len:407 (-),score=69.16 TRINITY_DN4989_c0_g1_i3:217-1437(-)
MKVKLQSRVEYGRSRCRSRLQRVLKCSTRCQEDDNLKKQSRRVVIQSGIVSTGCLSAISVPPSALSQQPSAVIPKTYIAEDLEISRIIKGCWQLSGGHKGDRETDRTEGKKAVQDFVKFEQAGISTFDTADIYGPSEGLIGQFVRQRGGPEGVQVLTKCCLFGIDQYNVSQEFINRKLNTSKQRLGVPKLDLVQFYWNDYDIDKYVAGAQYLYEAQNQGLLKHVGVTNFDVKRISEMIDGGVKIATSQVQYSLLDRRVENGMDKFCEQNDIKILPFGVLAGGFLSERYLNVPVSQVKLDTYSKSKYASVIAQIGGWSWFQKLLNVLNVIATKYDSTIANVACRWVLDRPGVAGIIVGARNAEHVDDHANVFKFKLDDQDIQLIEEVLSEQIRPQGDIYGWERGGKW